MKTWVHHRQYTLRCAVSVFVLTVPTSVFSKTAGPKPSDENFAQIRDFCSALKDLSADTAFSTKSPMEKQNALLEVRNKHLTSPAITERLKKAAKSKKGAVALKQALLFFGPKDWSCPAFDVFFVAN